MFLFIEDDTLNEYRCREARDTSDFSIDGNAQGLGSLFG